MTRDIHSCCAHHLADPDRGHHNDEFDPCWAKEIAAIERDRIRYEKLKDQSDRMLMSLNIRLEKSRARLSVSGGDEPDEDSEISSSPCELQQMYHLVPSGFRKFVSDRRGQKVITLISPCDFEDHTRSLSLLEEFTDLLSKPRAIEGPTVHSVFDIPVCVCGVCADKERRLSGSLRSLSMLLRGCPTVVVTRNGGMIGMWTRSDGPLADFIFTHS